MSAVLLCVQPGRGCDGHVLVVSHGETQRNIWSLLLTQAVTPGSAHKDTETAPLGVPSSAPVRSAELGNILTPTHTH